MCQCKFKTGYCNYISAGRGIGMKFAFLFSFLTSLAVAILFGIVLRMQWNINNVDSFIETLPVVKIQDGRIVEPLIDNVWWTIPGDTPEEDIDVVVNTTIDDVESIPPHVSAYITAKKIYTQDESGVHAYEIPEMENTVITHDAVKSAVTLVLTLLSVVIGIATLLTGLLSFLLAFVITLLFGKFFNRNITKSGWGRALVLPWVFMWVGSVVCSLSGYVTIPASPLLWIIVLSAFITLFLGNLVKKCSCETVSTEKSDSTDEPMILINEEVDRQTKPVSHSKSVVRSSPQPAAVVKKTAPVQKKTGRKESPVKKTAVKKTSKRSVKSKTKAKKA